MEGNPIYDKALAYAVRVVNMYKFLNEEKQERVMSKQLLRCGTSIGANISEALSAESTMDFVHKLAISQKEARETQYWLKLLHKTDYLTKSEFDSIESDAKEITAILTAICKKTNSKV